MSDLITTKLAEAHSSLEAAIAALEVARRAASSTAPHSTGPAPRHLSIAITEAENALLRTLAFLEEGT